MNPANRPQRAKRDLRARFGACWEPTVIALAVVLAYAGSFGGPFVFDDTKSIVTNLSLRHWSTAFFPPADLGVVGRPVLNFSLAINYALGGVSVAGYHLFNLIIHVLAALTLYGLVRRTWPTTDGRPAFWTALLWALHPVQTSSVTYVIQRAESLMGLFYLLTLYAFVRYAESRKLGWAAASIIACALGMGTKEVMVTAPILVLLYDRTFCSGSFGAALRRHAGCYIGLAAGWLVLAGLMANAPARGIGYGYGVTAYRYALTETEVVVRYLGLALWPFPLVLDYNLPLLSGLAAALPYVVVLIVLLSCWVWSFRRAPVLAFVGAVFFVILAPTSSVVPVALQPMAENRLYLPLAAVVILLVAAQQRWLRRGRGLAGAALAVIWGGLSFARSADYRSEEGLWADTVKRVPENPRALYNLGTVRLKAGYSAAAVEVLQRSNRIQPNDPEVLYNLGLALAGSGQWAESVAAYEAALRLRSSSAGIENNLGIALVQMKQPSEAMEHFAAAVRDDPALAEAQANWGNALYQSGQPEEASRHLAEAVRLRPEVAFYHIRLAMALAQAGDPTAAISEFEAALRLNPSDADTAANLQMLRRAVERDLRAR
jgi:tetratricopeptide (TPR) repeat protein